jgi:hypothetical protein
MDSGLFGAGAQPDFARFKWPLTQSIRGSSKSMADIQIAADPAAGMCKLCAFPTITRLREKK